MDIDFHDLFPSLAVYKSHVIGSLINVFKSASDVSMTVGEARDYVDHYANGYYLDKVLPAILASFIISNHKNKPSFDRMHFSYVSINSYFSAVQSLLKQAYCPFELSLENDLEFLTQFFESRTIPEFCASLFMFRCLNDAHRAHVCRHPICVCNKEGEVSNVA